MKCALMCVCVCVCGGGGGGGGGGAVSLLETGLKSWPSAGLILIVFTFVHCTFV